MLGPLASEKESAAADTWRDRVREARLERLRHAAAVELARVAGALVELEREQREGVHEALDGRRDLRQARHKLLERRPLLAARGVRRREVRAVRNQHAVPLEVILHAHIFNAPH